MDLKCLFDIFDLRPSMCSRFARLYARRKFGLDYTPANAWDLAETNLLGASFNRGDSSELSYFERRGLLFPGVICVGFFPNSTYNQEGRIGTHALVYLGVEDHEYWFAEQMIDSQRLVRFGYYSDGSMILRQIVLPKYFAREVTSSGIILI